MMRLRRILSSGLLKQSMRTALALAIVAPLLSLDSSDQRRETPDRRSAAAAPEIRVRLARSISETTIAGPRRVVIWSDAGSRRRAERTVATPISVRAERGRLIVRPADGSVRVYSPDYPLAVEGVGETPLTIDGAPYPGSIRMHANDDVSAFDLVEHIDIETYLPGVLSRELYPNWRSQTYEAQAIAARSYALQERQRRLAMGSHFDLESTTQDQAYGGSDASARARDAARRTRGLVLTYLDATLRAYYSSTCGGRPASARDTWPIGFGFEFNLAAPIQAVPRECPCSFSPRHRWEAERRADELVRRFRAFGASQGLAIRELTSLRGIEAERHNPAQRPATYRITDRDGRFWRLSAEQLRLALNHNGDTGLGRPTSDKTAWSGDVEAQVAGERIHISGRGFGHGVGMCQFGAEGMARDGATPEDILMRYYPTAEIRTLY